MSAEKNTGAPVKEKEEVFNRKAFINECKSVKKQLDKEPKVQVRLPVLKDANALNYVPVCINGYIYQIQRGVNVEVPKPVATQLEQGGYFDA